MPDTTFGDELRRLRREAKLSLADLADAIKSSITYVSDIERGRKNPPRPAKIMKLLATMGQEQQLSKMLALAVKARQSVEIPVDDKSDEVTDMLVALARRCDEGELPEEIAKKIRKLLEKGGD